MALHRLGWLTIPFLVAVLAVGIACGGGDDDDANGANGDATADGSSTNGETTPGDGEQTPDDGDTGGETPDTPTDDGSGDGGSDSSGDDDSSADGGDAGPTSEEALAMLRETADSLETEPYRVTYDMTATGIEGSFTLASNPPAQMFALEGTFEGQTGTVIVVSDDESLHFCSDFGGSQQCIKVSAENLGALPFTLPTTFQADELTNEILDVPGTTVSSAGSRTIAGIDADCYDVTSDEGDALVCVGDGRMLLLEGDFEGEQFRLEATEVDDSPGAIEVPDWPVTDLTNLGN